VARTAFVVFTMREHGNAVQLRTTSARYMHMKEVMINKKNHPDI
jgi:uncharacterized DUF497 family protein